MGDDEKLPNIISVKQRINHKPTMASTGITEVIFYCEKTILLLLSRLYLVAHEMKSPRHFLIIAKRISLPK